MKARFTRQFGRFGVGAEIELPDGSEFDRTYLEKVPEPAPEPKPEVKADGLQDHEEKPEAAAVPEAPKEGDK